MASGDIPMRHMLVGVNGSEAACRAADKAVPLAVALNARITFLGVANEEISPNEIADFTRAERLDAMPMPILADEARECLAAASKAAAREGLFNIGVEIRMGPVLEVLERTASEIGADTIVLGRSARAEWISAIFPGPLRRLPKYGSVLFV